MRDIFADGVVNDRSWAIYKGDCLDVMKRMVESGEKFDSVVTDPPYNLSSIVKRFGKTGSAPAQFGKDGAFSRASRGFMNCEWDSSIAFDPEVWRLALDLLKPGGYLLAFGGSRTFHRMVCAIEDAGFEIRDRIRFECSAYDKHAAFLESLSAEQYGALLELLNDVDGAGSEMAWSYGCLDEQTELVTETGVKPYHSAIIGEHVLCYNIDTGDYDYQPILEIIAYDYNDTAYRIIGDFGEQIVSRNHRCIIERDGREIFSFAEELAKNGQACIPFLENLSELQTGLYDREQERSQKENLRENMQKCYDWLSKSQTSEIAGGAQRTENHMQRLRQDKLETERLDSESENACLQFSVQRCSSGGGVGSAWAQRSRELESVFRNSAHKTYDRTNQPGMERRFDVSQPQREIRGAINQICSLSDRISINGEERRLCDGTSFGRGANTRSPTITHRSGSSSESQSDGEYPDKSDAIRNERRAQSLRTWRGHKTAMVRIVPFHYVGKVWCLRVPTGAFVAVRGGVAFPTGNSGFPKSHDVSKAIDKYLGKEREVVDSKLGLPGYHLSGHDGGEAFGHGLFSSTPETRLASSQITAPATPEAAKWEGWGSALKPAHEPICVARKPLEGTIAENVLKHGVGGMNIDGCRVEYEDTPNPASNPLYRVQNGYAIKTGSDSAGSSFSIKAEGGEVIANVAGRWPANIITDGSEEVLSCFPDAVGQIAKARNDAAEEDNNVFGKLKHITKLPDPRNDTATTAARFFYCAKANKEDRAGSKHPTVKPLKLLEYLCRLTCPPNGRILDMFAGSGSTLQAAINEGMNVVGIEKEDEYCVDIMMRMLALEAKS